MVNICEEQLHLKVAVHSKCRVYKTWAGVANNLCQNNW